MGFVIEVFIIAAAVTLISRLADMSDMSGKKWGGVTLVLCVLAFFLPFPIVRMGAIGVIMFIIVVIAKMTESSGSASHSRGRKDRPNYGG